MEKETIELVKKMIEDGNLTQEIAEKYCPELKKSEDEKIRKEIVETLKYANEVGGILNDVKCKEYIAWLEKQGRLMKALQISNAKIAELVEEKYNLEEKLKKQGEQNHKIIKGKNYFCIKTHNYAGVEWIKGTKYYASDNYTLVNQGCECYCPEYSKEEHNNLFEEVKCGGCVEKQGEQKPADVEEVNFFDDFRKTDSEIEPKFKVGDWVTIKE